MYELLCFKKCLKIYQFTKTIFYYYYYLRMKEMEAIKEEDRMRRLQILEKKIRDPRSVSNVDSLLVRFCL